MQASKIKIGDVFAIRDGNAKLVPFKVQSVTTTRTGPHSADFSSTVSGWMLNDDRSHKGQPFALNPDKLLGHFEQFVELVERKAAADAEIDRRNKAQRDLQMELTRLLYALTDLPMPEEVDGYKVPIRAARYGNEIVLSGETFKPLLDAMKTKLLLAGRKIDPDVAWGNTVMAARAAGNVGDN